MKNKNPRGVFRQLNVFNDICNRKKVIYARTFFHTDKKIIGRRKK